jgi:hypothetical protein
MRGLGPTDRDLLRRELVFLGSSDVALVARDTAQLPQGILWQLFDLADDDVQDASPSAVAHR